MGLWSRIKRTFRRESVSDEIQEELDFHLHMDAAEGRTSRQTHLRLGNLTRIEEDTRAMGIIEWLDSALQDARYGLRQLRKTPALAAAVVLSLSIGVGANTAIFSLVDAALLKPLPVNDPDALRIIEWTNDGFPSGADNLNGEFRPMVAGRQQGTSVSANLYRRLAREQTSFETLIGIAAYPDGVAIATDAFPAEQTSLQYVSSNFFQGLGVLPVQGRTFRDDEDRVGAAPVVIVSDRFWLRRFGGEPLGMGRDVRINSVSARIVGVATPGFFGLKAGQWPDIYAPLAAKVSFQPNRGPGATRGEDDRNWWVRQIGRLKPGVSEAAARAQIAGLFRNMATPEGAKVKPSEVPELISLPGRRGLDALEPKDANALWILMLLVAVLLLLVCANVANLLLSRAVRRQRESSVRLALGAARMRLFRQHLIESGVLAILGGAAGLGLGSALAQSIHLLFQTGRDASNAFDLHLDPRVLLYTSGLSILTALLFGLAPAVRAARADLGDSLKVQTRSVIGGGLRLPRLLVSVQIALCLTALVAAGLLGRSLEKMKWADVGFDRENLAYASVSPARAGYSIERTGPYVDRVCEELARLPGVLRVSAVQTRLLSGNGNNGRVNLPGHPWSDAYRANRNTVGEGFFETLRIPVKAGRPFDAHDTDAIVVDELFAKRFFPNENPLGRRLGLEPNSNNQYEIVGVVGDSSYNSLHGEAVPTVYQPYRAGGGTIHFAIRTTMDSGRLAESVRQAVASVDPAVPLTEFHTQTELIDRLLRTERLLSFVSGTFGLVALTLAGIGLGGLLSYAVALRTNELGVRMALGASRRDVVRMVLGDSLRVVGMGMILGLPCAWSIGRILKNFLFGLQPIDPQTALLSMSVLFVIALASAWFPARRAAGIDPMNALREE